MASYYPTHTQTNQIEVYITIFETYYLHATLRGLIKYTTQLSQVLKKFRLNIEPCVCHIFRKKQHNLFSYQSVEWEREIPTSSTFMFRCYCVLLVNP